MKHTQILFTPANAQKVHDGDKTCTRRMNGLGTINQTPNNWTIAWAAERTPVPRKMSPPIGRHSSDAR